jgi:NAD(P) transhydrogenase subunit beta
MSLSTVVAGLIGAVTFTGSIVAFGKLQEIKWFDRLVFAMQKPVNGFLALLVMGLAIVAIMKPEHAWLYWLIVLVSLVLGVLLVTPIGGADMPVVISLLNSYSGIAAAATGFVINNTVLIIAGALVGASGLILTKIMCVAMNRSLTNVLFGGMGVGTAVDKTAADAMYARVKSAGPEELAMLFDSAQRVVIVPGYGMAVSQSQHAVRDLTNLLESRGTHVEFAIHPVAGRMPGHMNVLLAEADVPYDKLKEMDEVNSEIEQVDVAIVIGANDTVNPIARFDPQSPIAGMPIINVDKARTVIVIKRSLSPGFAGIPNPLFANENTLMYFADGKKAVVDLIAALKAG